jgi:hypothetical protein
VQDFVAEYIMIWYYNYFLSCILEKSLVCGGCETGVRKVKVKVTLWLTASWPVRLGLSLIIFRQLRVCWCGAPSLKRGRLCNLHCNDASSMSSYIVTDGLSASLSWCRAPNGAHDQILISLFDNYFLSSRCRAPSPIFPTNRVIQPKVKVKSKI